MAFIFHIHELAHPRVFMLFLVGFVFVGLAFLSTATQASEQEYLRQGEQATVIQVVDGDTVILDHKINGARQVRLVGIQAPKLPLGRVGFPVWPLAEESKKALEKLTLGRKVNLYYGGSERDRHGRLLAHLYNDDGVWVQGEMLRLGMARVYTFSDNRSIAQYLYKQEHTAQAKGSGIWKLPFYAIRHPERLNKDIGTFQIIEGHVFNAAKVKSKVYLNFGADWRQDFTITLKNKALKLFKQSSINPLNFEGKSIRVRGWLKTYNGPMINVTHPEQIEIVSP